MASYPIHCGGARRPAFPPSGRLRSVVKTMQENYANWGFMEATPRGLIGVQSGMTAGGRMGRFVVVYWSGSDWRWRTLAAEGRILKSSEEGYGDRDGALEAAYRENPHTPVEVDVLFSASAG
jgi:uncharacterized protein YegP (UPF0339 family)